MNSHKFIPSLLFLLLAFWLSQCARSVDPVDLPQLILTADNVISTEVWLRVSMNNTPDPRSFQLFRDNTMISSATMRGTDTLMIDATALPKRAYTYKAYQIDHGARTLESDPVQVITLDTTSHAVQWKVDTLGVRGTIFDVWAFSSTNIWAVGEIYLQDATGQEDPRLYNLAQWDGTRWNITRVFYPQNFLSPIRGIFAFGPNDVWIGQGTQPMHWNGSVWQKFDLPASIFNGSVNRFWGSNSLNVFVVGNNGSIAHFEGTTWQKMESRTDVDLEDVWGIDETHIWAAGTSTQQGRSVVLSYTGSGNAWGILYDTATKPSELQFGFSSGWTNNQNVLYLAGSSGIRFLDIPAGIYRKPQTTEQYIAYRIRAVNSNDMYVGGAGSELLHYNGSTWVLYPEIKSLGGGVSFWHSVDAKTGFVTVGGEFFTGLFGVPVVLRGTR